ncbi:hypothetical protein KI387_007110, partial [Taxus chinensis]
MRPWRTEMAHDNECRQGKGCALGARKWRMTMSVDTKMYAPRRSKVAHRNECQQGKSCTLAH